MSFEVEAEDLVAHASHLDGVADRLNTALDAAKTVSMDDSAYGLLCSFLPPIVNPMEEKGVEAIGAAVEGVTTTADNVRKAAESYRETDRSHIEPLKKFQADAEGTKVVELAGTSGSASTGSSPMHRVGVQNDNSIPAHQAEPRLTPMQQGEPMSTPAHQAEHRLTPMQQGEPMSTPAHRADMRPEPFQQAESRLTPAHQAYERLEPLQRAEPMATPAHQAYERLEPVQRAEPMATPAHQVTERPEPFQAAERPDQSVNRII